ncbi:MAG TPA: hypothetical protein VMI06_04470 [Terriglobia bacterium]|nr:hypothetical protein [Terriglobia bacterium]
MEKDDQFLYKRTPDLSLQSGTNSCDDDSTVRGILTDAMRRCAKSRAQIADELSVLVGCPVTEGMLNAFTAQSRKGHRWPSAWDRAFCHVTGDLRLIREKVERAGFKVIDREDAEYLEIGKQYLAQKHAAEELSRLEGSVTNRGKKR